MFKKEFPIHELKWSLLRFKYNLELISYIYIDVTCEVQVYSISSNFLTVTDAPPDQNFLNFMQFLGKSGKFVCWCPPEVGVPSYGESCIHL